MGDFFIPGPGGAGVPPEPDTPPPDFRTVGANIGLGLSDAGALSGIWQGFVDAFVRAFAAVVGWVIVRLGKLAAFIINAFATADEEASQAYGPLVSASLKALLGVDVPASQMTGMLKAENRADLAQSMGQAMFSAIFAGVNQSGSAGLQPSDTGPKQYLGQMAHMAVEGWMQSWILDALSYHELERFGELKDTLARVMGLGRMSRQMLHAPLQVLITEPYLMLLNEKYRPKQIAEATAMREFFRGQFDRNKLSEILGRQGYSEQYIDFLIAEHTKYLPLNDVDWLVSRGTWTTDDAAKYLQEQGYDAVGAQHTIEILADRRIHKYRMQIVEAAMAAFERKNIPIDQLQQIVSTSGLTDEEQTWMLKVAGIRQELRETHLSRADIEKGIRDGILNFNDLRAWALRENMPLDEEQWLELMLQFDINKQTASEHAKAAAAQAKATAAKARLDAAAQKAANAKALAADKGVTVAQAETLVKDGLWTFDHLTAFLTAKGYGADAIAAIAELLHAKMGTTAAAAAAAPGVRATAAAKQLPLATMEKAFVDGIITEQDLSNAIAAHGFSADDVAVVVTLAKDAKESADAKAAAKAATHKTAGAKQLSLAELDRAVRLGLTSVDTYTAALQAAGFEPMSITLLVGILDDQIAADKVAAAKRGAAATKATSRGVTLAQLEQEVIAGVRPIADYTAELQNLGYNAADREQLTELLQLKVDHQKTLAAKRDAAAAALDARGISLSQAERAVKLGVVPITTYQDELTAAHYTQDAIDVLSHALLAEMAKTAKAAAASKKAGAAVAAKGISLPQLERAVIDGLRPIGEYTDVLIGAGYPAADASTLTELLQLKVDQAAYAQQRHADAEGLATQKGLSLAEEESAVIAGDATMENFDAFLSALGYDAIDRAILAALLNEKIQAAAAKAAKSGAKSGAAPPAPTGG